MVQQKWTINIVLKRQYYTIIDFDIGCYRDLST